ncbi:MAG: 30S ribosomal protein S8 [Candidatus Margulisiibacteriota bacterium]
MDTIADMLAKIKNAFKIRKEIVEIPYSKTKEGITKIMLTEGYISRFDIFNRAHKKFIRINLKYSGRKSVIEDLKRISKPGRRVYCDAQSIPKVQSGFGTAIISTSQGLMTDEEARQKKIGGEVICYIW